MPEASAGEMVLSARVHVPLPLFVAAWVCPPTVMLMVAVLSFTVPESGGVLSPVRRLLTVIAGAVPSMRSSSVVASLALLPTVSVAVTETL